MRDIKFRAWNKSKGVMAIVAHISNLLTVGEYIDVRMNEPDAVTNIEEEWNEGEYILMQFTGLLDKKGKEIYEGDIVSYTWEEDMGQWNKNHAMKATVEWAESKAGFAPFYRFDDYECRISTVEVIGNIHSNPELLKDKVS